METQIWDFVSIMTHGEKKYYNKAQVAPSDFPLVTGSTGMNVGCDCHNRGTFKDRMDESQNAQVICAVK